MEDNPWGVEVLDLRPVTQGYLSTTTSREIAERFVYLQQVDGQRYRGVEAPGNAAVEVELCYAAPEGLWDGVLFQPRAMEDKWALYVVGDRILAVRSWTGDLVLAADFELVEGKVCVRRVRGALFDGVSPDLRRWSFDALLRVHVWQEPWPVPLPPGSLERPERAGKLAMNIFGRRALFGAEEEPSFQEPPGPLVCNSLLHIALARGDLDAARAHLDGGIPVDAHAQDGLPTLAWAATAAEWESAMALLLDAGCPVDVRGTQGATTLMVLSQRASTAPVQWLLGRGADIDAVDHRGFSALHRAAELGHAEVVRLLLAAGADPAVEALEHTPRSLAELRGHSEIAALLDGS